MKQIGDVAWDRDGHVAVVVQDASTGAVLAVDTMDHTALLATLTTGRATYWVPEDGTAGGCAATGPLQMLTAAYLGCDGRALLLQVQAAGPLCQQGAPSCFAEALSLEPQPPADARSPLGQAAETDAGQIEWSPGAAEGA